MADLFTQLKEAQNESNLYVQKVKLGDALFYLQGKIITTERLISDLENSQARITDDNIREWYQAKIDAYSISLDMLKDVIKSVKGL